MSRVRILALALAVAVGAPLGARAVDQPHEAGTNCSNCHMGHNAPGASMTKEAGNFNLCQSCHLKPQYQTHFGFPWTAGDQAVVGASGTSHSWSAPATNLGATAPAPGTPMGDRLDAGSLQCSTCHDEHQSDALLGSPADPANLGTQHVSAITFVSAGGNGTVTLAAGSPAAGATAKAYRVEIVAGGSSTTATFKLSNDNGVSWFGCSAPGSYVTYVASPSNACQVGASVALNDGANVTVAFAGGASTYAAGDRWDFYVSYPFLRIANKDAAMCTECHKDRNMTWQNADGTGPIVGTGASVVFGTTVFSHPVGQALNQGVRTNGLPAILDANGMVQSTSTDTNKTNDFVTGTGGIVTCLTCHHPHNADSNSISVDPR